MEDLNSRLRLRFVFTKMPAFLARLMLWDNQMKAMDNTIVFRVEEEITISFYRPATL